MKYEVKEANDAQIDAALADFINPVPLKGQAQLLLPDNDLLEGAS